MSGDRAWVERMWERGDVDHDTYRKLLAILDMAEFAEQERFAELATSLDATESQRDTPMPGECHPAYTDRREMIVHWLDGGFAFDVIRLPVPRRRAFMIGPDAMFPTVDDLPAVETLSRRRCAGAAPYVGEPFRYEWWVAEDTHKRWVAGEARRVPLMLDPR